MSARPYYHKLIEAGIYHPSPWGIGSHIRAKINSMESWRGSAIVRKAREEFCERYASVSLSPLLDIRNLVKEHLAG